MTATDALDNPSYFALAAASGASGASGRPSPEPPPTATPAPPTRPLLPLLKRRPRATVGARTTSQGSAGCAGGNASSRRLGFRWLLRSVSGSSTSLQQIAQGQPRPGDVAPPSPTADALPLLDGPLASPGPVVGPGRLREHREHRTVPRVATPTTAAPRTAAPAAPSSCGYYNVEGLRRHSVGSLVHGVHGRARTPASSVPTPAARPASVAAATAVPAPFPDDIVLVWSGSGGNSAASLWITYLQSCFVEICRKRGRPSFRTSDVSVDELGGSGEGAERWRSRLEQAKLVVLVVCPALLARVSACPAALAGPMARLDSERALVMLLGVHEHELLPEHRAVLGGDCKRMSVRDQDANFVGEFLAVAMDILVRTMRARAAKDHGLTDGGARFSLAPKKVKQGMNKVMVLLHAALQPWDYVEVAVCKSGDPVKVPTRTRNPYTIQFAVPESMLDVSAMVNVTVSVNGLSLGCRQLKCEGRLRELDRILRAKDNPVQFLCQTLGFGPNDREALDNSLLSSYLRNVPPNFHLLSVQGDRPSYSCEMYPTLLHFAAHVGLERLAMALLEGPGGEQACHIRNCDDLTPAELSERAGYSRLSCALQGYMQMSELSNVYSMLTIDFDSGASGMSPAGAESSNYLSPRPASETYSVPPPPAPVASSPVTSPEEPSPPRCATPAAAEVAELMPSPDTPPDPYVDMAGDTRRMQGPSSLYQNMVGRSQSESPTPLGHERALVTPLARRHSAPETEPEEAPECAVEAAEDAAVYQDIDYTVPPAFTPHSRPAELIAVPNEEAPEAEAVTSTTTSAAARLGWLGRRGSDPAVCSSWRDQRGQRGQPASVAGEAPDPDPDADEDKDSFVIDALHGLKSSSLSLGEVEHLVQSWHGRNATHQSYKEKQETLVRMHEELERVERRLGPLQRIKRVFARARNGKSKAKGGRAGSGGGSHGDVGGGTTSIASTARPASSLSRRSSSSSTWSGKSNDPVESPRPVEVDEVSWLHPVSPASDEHYVSPLGVRPVVPGAMAAAQSQGLALDLADDGFPLDPSGFSSYVNVSLPSWPPPVPARASSSASSHL